MNAFVNIKKSKIKGNVCNISKDVIDRLSLFPGKTYLLKFGRCTAEAKLGTSSKGEEPEAVISQNIFARLGIPEDIHTGITVKGNEIMFGPVLGVFVNPSYTWDLKNQTPRPSSKHLLKANENSNLFVYFFTVSNADWLGNKIEGWYYSRNSRKWIGKMLPLPDVVYDRGVGFASKDKNLVEHFRSQFTPAGAITRINSTDCLDKYWLHERLKLHGGIRKYLPETIRYNSIQDLSEMLKKHRVVYLKSFYGSCGEEIMTVASLPGDLYECSYFDSDILKHKTTGNTSELSELIEDFFGDKSFVIQQGIDLLEYDKSRLDMRILIQKDGRGLWTGVYNVVIKGKKASLITAGEEKGARFYNFCEIMPLVLNKANREVEELDRQIRQSCIDIAKAIEKEYGPFGEIGMDMALDKDHRIWFIEANSKPDRELESGIIGSARVRATCINIIDYTKYLAGFG